MDHASRSEFGKLPFKAAAQSNIEPTCSTKLLAQLTEFSRIGVLQQPLANNHLHKGDAHSLSLRFFLATIKRT